MARKTLTLTIDLEGATLADDYADQEVAMLLRSAAQRIQDGALNRGFTVLSTEARPLALLDTNGNTVGHVQVLTDEAMAATFREAWHDADEAGRSGERVTAGLKAALGMSR